MNSAGWTVTWERTLAEPTSVKAAAPAAVGRSAANPPGAAWPHSRAGGQAQNASSRVAEPSLVGLTIRGVPSSGTNARA